MAGRGLAPKPADRRARRNADPIASTVLEFVPGQRPPLPQLTRWDDDLGARVVVDWHPETVTWWDMWDTAQLSDTFTATDWSFLLDTALLHTRYWDGDLKMAAELRLRVAKFGATPEDRARLRIVFADADERDDKRNTAGAGDTAKARYGDLRAVDGGS